MLQIEDIEKTYRGRADTVRALAGVGAKVHAGEFAAVVGPSGCGKTTLLLVCGGLLRPDRGTVALGGRNLYDLDPEQRARFRSGNVGFVFQKFHLVPYLSVRENVLAAALARPSDDAETRADELIERFDLADRADHVPGELSTGEQQRVAMARAVLNRPKLVLADEPTGNLDPANAEVVIGHLAEVADDEAAVLMVTHDPATAERADRTIAMADGSFV